MLEQAFAEGNSVIHRLDPRSKVVAAVAFSIITAVSNRCWALALALVLAVALVALAKLPFRAVSRRLLVVNGFLFLLWLMVPFTYPGEAVFRVGPLVASREGFLYALLITIKSNAIILACIALLSTTHLTDIGRALARLHIPEKIVQVLLFMLRYLGLIAGEYQRLRTSMSVRGFRPRTDLHTYRSYANMVGMLLISSYERAEAVYSAMLCRGFDGRFYTTHEFSFHGLDAVFGVLMTISVIVIGLLQWGPVV